MGAVINTANAREEDSVAIVGLGGVGLSALLASLAVGSKKTIAIDLSDEKLTLARELGADHTLNPKDENFLEQIRDLTSGGANIAIETAGSGHALETAYNITRRGGTTVAAGMPGPGVNITLSHLSIAAEERVLKGSYMGSCVAQRDIPKYLNMFQTGKLPVDRLLSRKIKFEDLNEAMDRLDDAKTVREVLIP